LKAYILYIVYNKNNGIEKLSNASARKARQLRKTRIKAE